MSLSGDFEVGCPVNFIAGFALGFAKQLLSGDLSTL